MKGLWDRVHIQLYYLFALADLFFYGEVEEREVSACGNLCANNHKDKKKKPVMHTKVKTLTV